MTIIDLSSPPPRRAPGPAGLLDALPRRVALTLPELRCVAAHAGDAPLPFEVREPADGGPLEDRLGRSRGSVEDHAWTTALAALHEPTSSLARRGLLVAGELDDGLAGAAGLLATPEVALDLDVAVETPTGPVHARAWHRQAGGAVASLATTDGVVFELAWFPTAQWPAELARVGALPEEVVLAGSSVPEHVDLPFELADAAAEAVRSSRPDLLAVLAAQEAGAVRGADGAAYGETAVVDLLAGLSAEVQGRLRALVADVSGAGTTVVGVLSWVLLADGWHAVQPRRAQDRPHLEVRRVEPEDLGPLLAPVLAQVTR